LRRSSAALRTRLASAKRRSGHQNHQDCAQESPGIDPHSADGRPVRTAANVDRTCNKRTVRPALNNHEWPARWMVVLGRSRLRAASDFSWSHLWSHSCRFRRVRGGLRGLGSGGARPNRTGLNHQQQNSKAREVKASEGSNPSATARLIQLRRSRLRTGSLPRSRTSDAITNGVMRMPPSTSRMGWPARTPSHPSPGLMAQVVCAAHARCASTRRG
jgi:hypothetical protein